MQGLGGRVGSATSRFLIAWDQQVVRLHSGGSTHITGTKNYCQFSQDRIILLNLLALGKTVGLIWVRL